MLSELKCEIVNIWADLIVFKRLISTPTTKTLQQKSSKNFKTSSLLMLKRPKTLELSDILGKSTILIFQKFIGK